VSLECMVEDFQCVYLNFWEDHLLGVSDCKLHWGLGTLDRSMPQHIIINLWNDSEFNLPLQDYLCSDLLLFLIDLGFSSSFFEHLCLWEFLSISPFLFLCRSPGKNLSLEWSLLWFLLTLCYLNPLKKSVFLPVYSLFVCLLWDGG